MFKFVSAIIISLLMACTCPGIIGDQMTDQDFITEHGIEVYPQENWVSQREIEIATETFILDVAKTMPDVYPEEELRKAMDGTKVYVEPHNFTCLIKLDGKLSVTWCQGTYQNMGKKVRYVNRDCIGEAAFVHEMIHLINRRVEHFSGDGHVREEFFSDDEGSLEYDINKNIQDELCPSCWGL